jgi:hypothetical protein
MPEEGQACEGSTHMHAGFSDRGGKASVPRVVPQLLQATQGELQLLQL